MEKSKSSSLNTSIGDALNLSVLLEKPTAFFGHGDRLNTLMFSHDSKYLLSSGGYTDIATVKLWDIEAKQLIHTFYKGSAKKNKLDRITSCVFSPDSKLIAAICGYKTLKVWNRYSGEMIHNLTIQSARFCSFTHDGNYIVAAGQGIIMIVDAQTGEVVNEFSENHPNERFPLRTNTLSISQDNKSIITSGEGRILTWDIKTGKLIKSFIAHDRNAGPVRFASISIDGKWIISYNDAQYNESNSQIKIWSTLTSKLVHTLENSNIKAIKGLTISHDSKHIIASLSILTAEGHFDGLVYKIWDIETGKLLYTIENHKEDLGIGITVSPNSKYIASSVFPENIKILDAKTGTLFHEFLGHKDAIFCCKFLPDGKKIISGNMEGSTTIWDYASSKPIHTLKETFDNRKAHPINACTFSYDGLLVMTAGMASLKIWNSKSGEFIKEFINENSSQYNPSAHSGIVRCCSFSSDNKYALSGGGDTKIKIWDIKSAKLVRILTGHRASITACYFSPDSKQVISCSDDKTVRIWDVETGRMLKAHKGHTDKIRFCSISPDYRFIVSASNDNSLKIWNIKPRKRLHSLEGHEGAVVSCDISSDSIRIVSASEDNTLKIWNAETGKLLQTFPCHEQSNEGFRSCSFSPDDQFIITATENNAFKLWDAESGLMIKEYYLMPNHQSAVIDRINQKIIYQSANANQYLGKIAHDTNGCISRFPV